MSENTVPVLAKAIAILKALADKKSSTTTKSLGADLGISHSTAYRILQTLIAEDWVRPVAGGQHELSLGLLPLVQPLVRHELLVETVREPLHQLAVQAGLTTKLSVRQGDQAVTLYREESPRPTAISVKIGASFHLTQGSSGAVLLSALTPEERRRIISGAPADCWLNQRPADIDKRLRELDDSGHCIDHGQYRMQIAALSAAIRNRQGQVVAALTLVGFPSDFEAPVERRRLARHLCATAEACSQGVSGIAYAA